MVENATTKDNLYPYDPIRQNSNTLADSVLKDAGLKQPTQDGITGHLAPGSGKPLDKDVKPRSAEDLGISNVGEAISLNNNQPAPTEFQLALAPESQQLLKDSERHIRALTDRHQLAWDQGMDNTVHAVALEAREQGRRALTTSTSRTDRSASRSRTGLACARARSTPAPPPTRTPPTRSPRWPAPTSGNGPARRRSPRTRSRRHARQKRRSCPYEYARCRVQPRPRMTG